VKELLYQALETERAGVAVYEAAIECATSDALRIEWEKFRDQTREHESILRDLLLAMDCDPERRTPGRDVVGGIGRALVDAIRTAQAQHAPETAELVAAECVVHAETTDHLNWELIGRIAGDLGGDVGDELRAAHEEVDAQEDRHLERAVGWCRELWIDALGLRAVLPPPEETEDVRSALAAARVKQAREGTI